MAIVYVETSTPDLNGFWDTFGGASPGSDRNMISDFSYTPPVGGATLKKLRRGMDSATSQAGGTVEIGIIDVTSAPPYPVVYSISLPLRSDNAGYVWSEVDTNFFMTAGHTYRVYTGKPSVQVWHTRGDAIADSLTPSTLSLGSSVTPNESGRRLIPLSLGYELPTTSVTLQSPVRVGGTGYSATTVDLGTVTSLTNATITGTSTNAFTYNMNSFVDGQPYLAMGSQSQTAGDGTKTATNVATIQPMTGYSFVAAAAPLNTGAFSLAKDSNFVAGVVVHWPTAAGTINSDMTLTDFVFGSYSCWRRDVDGTMRSFTLTVSDSGAIVTDTGKLTSSSMTSGALTSRSITGRAI